MKDLGLPRGGKELVLFPVPVGPEMDNPTDFRRQFLFRIS